MKLVSLLSVLLTSLVPCMGASGQATKPAARSVKTSKPNDELSRVRMFLPKWSPGG